MRWRTRIRTVRGSRDLYAHVSETQPVEFLNYNKIGLLSLFSDEVPSHSDVLDDSAAAFSAAAGIDTAPAAAPLLPPATSPSPPPQPPPVGGSMRQWKKSAEERTSPAAGAQPGLPVAAAQQSQKRVSIHGCCVHGRRG